MKLTLITFLLLFGLTGCSNNPQSGLGFLNAIANFKLVEQQDAEVNDLYKKYSPLLNESEQKQATATYEAIKKAADKPSLKTPIDYLVAKNLYTQIIPLYSKYKNKIDNVDQVTIEGIHGKLKSISEAIDKAIDGSVKNEMTLEYIKTATLLIGAFA